MPDVMTPDVMTPDVMTPDVMTPDVTKPGAIMQAVPTAMAMANEPQRRHTIQCVPLLLEQVREQVQTDDTGKWDIVLPREAVLMQGGKLMFPDGKAYECEDGLVPTPWAQGQICGRLNMPTSYFRKCPAFLQDAQFNFWNGKRRSEFNIGLGETLPTASADSEESGCCDPRSEPTQYQNGWPQATGNGHQFRDGIYTGIHSSENWLLRAKDQTLRAVLTDRYTPLDNRTLLECLHKTLPSHLEIQWLALDNESFHLRIIDPRMTREVLPGDPMMAGIHVSNSETGRRSVTVDCLVFRQVCTNGLIKLVKGKSILSQRHVAVSPAHLITLLYQSLSVGLSTATRSLEQMEWSTKEPLRNVEAELKSLNTHWHLSQSFVEQVKAALAQERSDQQETVFGLVNAITQSAQSLDVEARYEMEIMAGKLLERKSQHNGSSLHNGKAMQLVRVPAAANGNGNAKRNGEGHGNEERASDYSSTHSIWEAAEVLFEAQAVKDEVGPSSHEGNSEVVEA